MMTERLLRFVAFAMAGLAMVDPAVPLRFAAPLPVEMVVASTDQAESVRDRLLDELRGEVSVVRRGHGRAVVAIDTEIDIGYVRDGVPMSFVTLNGGPNVRLQGATFDAVPLFPGERSQVNVDAVGDAVSGKRSRLAVLQDGIEIGGIDHLWTAARHQRISLPFVALSTGSHPVQIVSTPLPEERRSDDNVLDAVLTVNERPFDVAFLEYRPTWSARFVREALAGDARLRVSSATRVSRGVAVRSGNPPSSTASGLAAFEVLAVGAPEELRASDVSQLRQFMTHRGGAVLLLPDRRPAGAYAELIPAAAFDEVLLRAPATSSVTGAFGALRGTEFTIPREAAASMRSLASLPDGKPIVVSWPVGAGTLIVCGALDAWRYRASDDQQFASFWRAVVTGAARRVPPALSVELDPQVAGPGARVQVRARVRRTEFEQEATAMRVPAIAGTAQSDSGSTPALVRFWPTGEPGVFTGEFVPSEPRRYAVLVNSGHAQAAAVLLPGSDRSRFGGDEEAALVAEASGGVVTTADQLTPLVNHLRRHPRDDRAATVFPTRNPWWIAPFTMALCAEWMLRRRRGRR